MPQALRLSKKSKDFFDSLQKCRYFRAAQRRKSPCSAPRNLAQQGFRGIRFHARRAAAPSRSPAPTQPDSVQPRFFDRLAGAVSVRRPRPCFASGGRSPCLPLRRTGQGWFFCGRGGLGRRPPARPSLFAFRRGAGVRPVGRALPGTDLKREEVRYALSEGSMCRCPSGMYGYFWYRACHICPE